MRRVWSRSCAGMGYAGAYIGGTHKSEHFRWIIDRGQATRAAMGRTRKGTDISAEDRLLHVREEHGSGARGL